MIAARAMSFIGFPRRRVEITILAVLLGACSAADNSVVDTLHVDPGAIRAAGYAPVAPTLCKSSLGSYSLPKTFLKVAVTRTGDGPPQIVDPVPIRRVDNSLTFCLDHLADPMADDEIRIIKSSGQVDASYGQTDPKANDFDAKKVVAAQDEKGYGSQLLQWVVSNTVDQSEYIARTLVRTAFVGLSGKSNFTPLARELTGRGDAAQNVAVLEYDPFDAGRSALVNQRLRELGYCLILEHFTFDTRRMTVDQYCNAPRIVGASPFDEAYAKYQSGPPPRIGGIAYRPRIYYALSIYQKPDPKGAGRWRLYKQQRVSLENISPLVSVGVTRSIFAARRVALKFDMGVLTAMCLVKTSELQSAVAVPYEIAKSIIVLPTQVFEVKIGNISDNVALVTAEDNLVKAQQEYLSFLTDATKKTVSDTSTKTFQDLPTLPNPVPTVSPVPRSTVASIAELQSSVLNDICKNAPSVISPTSQRPAP